MKESEMSQKKGGIQRGSWSSEEDELLINYVKIYGEGKWRRLVQHAGLKRCPKSARQRWKNYLNPKIKRGDITDDEQDLIIRLHRLLGNRWSLIAGRLPGRTDNQIKNYWNTYIVKKMNVDCSSSNNNNNMQKKTAVVAKANKLLSQNNKTDNLVGSNTEDINNYVRNNGDMSCNLQQDCSMGLDDDHGVGAARDGMTLLDMQLMIDLFPDLDGWKLY